MIKTATTLAFFAAIAGGLTGCAESTGTTADVMMSGEVAMPMGLTSEERLIWNSLNDEAKRDAVAYMEAGGSFKQFVAADPAA